MHYHGAAKSSIKVMDNYKGEKGYFLKKFLIDPSKNLNKWRVTEEAIEQDLESFIGQPLVMTPKLVHPPTSNQERFRIGTIKEVGYDKFHKAWEVVKLKNKGVYEQLKAMKTVYGSPTVHTPMKDVEFKFKGTPMEETILHRMIGKHDAIVGEPAYGKLKDKAVALCEGDGVGCGMKLKEVQAACENCEDIENAEINDDAINQITVVPFCKTRKKKAELQAKIWKLQREQANLKLMAKFLKDDQIDSWITIKGHPLPIPKGKKSKDVVNEYLKKQRGK